MKWNVKPKKPIPIKGDTEERMRFAFLPIRVEDKLIWLEKYISIYQYQKCYYKRVLVAAFY